MTRTFAFLSISLAFFCAAAPQRVFAQAVPTASLRIVVRNADTKEPVAGASVNAPDVPLSAMTGADGRATLNVPAPFAAAAVRLEISAPGYETVATALTPGAAEQVAYLKVSYEAGEVIVNTTRTGRDIEDTPTRVEAIDEEEIGEKLSMRPSNVSMLLNESTGIKVQQTSASSYTQSVRIQGLDGRYTQILKDGFPAFGGFSGSLTLLDIPPLDLRQVEIVKGAASTFYGEGAIAGVVNFISKEPGEKPSTSAVFNQTSALGTDASVFTTRKFARVGYTLLGTAGFQREYDADGDRFTELPRTRALTLNPRLFLYPDASTRVSLGTSLTFQRRRGGDIDVIRGNSGADRRYLESNDARRSITTFQVDRDLDGGRKFVAKQSIAFFRRELAIPGGAFDGGQFNSYTDVSFFAPVRGHALVAGVTAVYDRFREDRPTVGGGPVRDETRRTFGGFVQDTFSLTPKLLVEAGLRIDKAARYGVFALPRVSLLYRFTDRFSSRVGYGLGYKTPSIFTEEAETLFFRDVRPIGAGLRAERSDGGTLDFNYRGSAFDGKVDFSVNQMFFFTNIRRPLFLDSTPAGERFFANASQPVRTKGFETNVRAAYRLARLFAGYTYTDARLRPGRELPLTPRSRLNSSLLLEKEDSFKAGLEAYYTGRQTLASGARTPDYWVVGIFAEKNFGRFSLFVNAENITDTRQSRFGPVALPPRANPTFAEIYTHTEGRIFNGGIKLRL